MLFVALRFDYKLVFHWMPKGPVAAPFRLRVKGRASDLSEDIVPRHVDTSFRH